MDEYSLMPLLTAFAAMGLAWRQRHRRLATQKAGGLIVEDEGVGAEAA